MNSRTPFGVINGFFILVGCIAIGFTVYARSEKVSELVGVVWFGPAVALGVFTVILGAVGAYGSCKANSCMLYIYSAITFVFAVSIIGLGAYAVNSGGKDSGKVIIDNAWKRSHSDLTSRVETTYKCCGLYELEADCAALQAGMQSIVSNDTAKIAKDLTAATLPAIDAAVLDKIKGEQATILNMAAKKVFAYRFGADRYLLSEASVLPAQHASKTLGVCATKEDCYAHKETAACTKGGSCVFNAAATIKCAPDTTVDKACLAKKADAKSCVDKCAVVSVVASPKTCGPVLLKEFQRLYINMGVSGVFLALIMSLAFAFSLRLACVGGDVDKGARM